MLSGKWQHIVGFGLLILILLLFQWPYFNLYPTSVHAWAQADYYALTKGFIRNDFNFFLPQEYIYNKQFPGEWKIADSTTITAVNFPIHQYLIALLMKLTGSQSPFLFRFYTFVFSVIGLRYLYGCARMMRLSHLRALFLTALAASSPLFIYYQANFMVTIPALATAIWGIYYYLRHLQAGSSRYWKWAIVLLTLAALTRSTFAVPLLAVFGHQVLIALRTRKVVWRRWLFLIAGLIVLAGYQLYNSYLTAAYGSNFLSELKPASGWNEFWYLLDTILEYWQSVYFTGLQWLVVTIVCTVLFLRLPRLRHKPVSDPAFFLSIYVLGALCFFIAMERQFIFHDYYFLDNFFLPLLLVTCYGFGSVADTLADKGLEKLIMVIVIFISLLNGWHELKSRYAESNDVVSRTMKAFQGAEKLLAENHVPKDAKIMVFGTYGPNAPFLLFDRNGYSVDHIDPKFFSEFRNWDVDYILISSFHLREILIPNFPYLTEQLEPIATNFEVGLFRFSDPNPNRTVIHLLVPENATYNYFSLSTPTGSRDDHWEFLPAVTANDSSGMTAFQVFPTSPFGFKWTLSTDVIPGRQAPKLFTLRAKVKVNDPSAPHEFDVFGLRDGKEVLFQAYYLNQQLKPTRDWQWVTIYTELPNETSPYTLGIHHYNGPGKEIWMDSLQIGIY